MTLVGRGVRLSLSRSTYSMNAAKFNHIFFSILSLISKDIQLIFKFHVYLNALRHLSTELNNID